MIYYNDIELDYDEKTLYKFVIKKSLSSLESLKDKKGTKSTHFKVPKTSHNIQALGFVDTNGSQNSTVGIGRIEVDGNTYDTGIIYIKGYDNETFELLFLGSNMSFINSIENIPMRKTIIEESTNLYNGSYLIYNDFHFKNSMENITSGQLDYTLIQPQLLLNFVITGGTFYNFNSNIVAPAFTFKSIIKKIVENQGYNLVSKFFDSEFGSNLIYSNYKGIHKASTFFLNSTNNITTLKESIDLGNVSFGIGFIKSSNNYLLTRSIDNLQIKFDLDVSLSVKTNSYLLLTIYNASGESIKLTQPYKLINGINNIYIEIAEPLANSSYFEAEIKSEYKDGASGPISVSVDVENMIISHDGILEGDYIALADYLGDMTQLEFISNTLKRFDLILDVENDNVYIDLVNDCKTLIDNESIDDFVNGDIDISDDVESKVDAEIDYDKIKNINFKQNVIDSAELNGIILNENESFGSYNHIADDYSNQFNEYTDSFNTVFDYLRDAGTTYNYRTKEPYTEWENIIGLLHAKDVTIINNYNGYREKLFLVYENLDGTIDYDAYIYFIDFKSLRYDELCISLFKKTLTQRKNNKKLEIELYDNKGTLMSFKKNYIINNQKYRLLEYEFEPISKKVKAQIILK